ncbi:MAG TPA: HAMP domain-containing sensor histidine kinase, partial [Flavisolibacter sp.]|nr:HAMP domain-containing sensor histidine kinase [Flavisolibacter sp.]
ALRRKLRYEHLVNVQQQELHQMKMDFFTHISHEIRTPLTLIMGPVEMLMNKIPARAESYKLLLTIKSNAERLLKLTTDLLEFRKADSGYTQLRISKENIVAFTQAVYGKFVAEAGKKAIAYTFETNVETIAVYFDPHQMEMVLSNLLSNALKFTPEGGKVTVGVEHTTEDRVDIRVCDNGVGIPKESQEKIFTNFYQADSGKAQRIGSGIGLAFSKSLVELHRGYLYFSSGENPENGSRETCFVISLKLGTAHLNQSDLVLN